LYLTVIAAGFEHEEDGFGGYFEKTETTYSGLDDYGDQELTPGNTITFEGESAGNQMNEEARFAYMVEQYVNGGPSEREFDVPTYRRNAAKLISLDSLRRDEWVVTDLYEN
jgi:hypothetical protein